MEENMTALISCFARAYHTKNYESRIYDDPIAEKILGTEDYNSISCNMEKGISFFNPSYYGSDALRYIVDNHLSPAVLGRSIFAEKTLEISKRLGAKQYLILASGYDASCFKNQELSVFEVDRDEVIKDKKKRLEKANIDYSFVHYISANLLEDEWLDLLVKAHFNPQQKTFCSLLGISYYLSREQFEQTLIKIASILPFGSEIVFDYPNYNLGKEEYLKQELAKEAKEEMKSNYKIEDIERIGEKSNLLIYENMNNEEMTNNYFSEYNRLNPSHKIIAPKGVSYCLLVKKTT